VKLDGANLELFVDGVSVNCEPVPAGHVPTEVFEGATISTSCSIVSVNGSEVEAAKCAFCGAETLVFWNGGYLPHESFELWGDFWVCRPCSIRAAEDAAAEEVR